MKKTCARLLFSIALIGAMNTSCSPTRFYKPLEQGEQTITASFGGPIINVPGIASMPIPFTTIGYGRGITKELTVFGAWHTASSIFGVAHLDLGATHGIWKNEKMGLSASASSHFMIDIFEWKPSLYPQISANYYYTLKRNESKKSHFDFYLGTENWIDLRSRLAHDVPNTNRLLWNMHIGQSYQKNLWSYQLEFKLLAPYLNNDVVVDYISPLGNRGGMGIYFGIQRKIGKS